MNDRLTVREASEILGISQALLRYQMDTGGIDVGTVVSGKNGRRTHLIYKSKVEKIIGRRIDETLRNRCTD